MKIAHKLKREGRAKDQSAAMVKSYKIIERAGKLRTDSIQDECDDIIYTCEMGLWNNIQTHYPCLMTGMNGVYNISKPKKEAVILIAQITKHFCSFIGYKG